jgi:hypothetical protein
MPNLSELVNRFLLHAESTRAEIYNEFSLQHELGIFLRENLPNYRVQFERNVSYFGNDKRNFTKREIDIAVFLPDKTELKLAIELKFPRQGQVPEQMYSFCKDIAFIEELKHAGFKEAGLLILVDNHLFYEGAQEGIYAHFRGRKPITGIITKPTGAKTESVKIDGSHQISWSTLNSGVKYTLITA